VQLANPTRRPAATHSHPGEGVWVVLVFRDTVVILVVDGAALATMGDFPASTVVAVVAAGAVVAGAATAEAVAEVAAEEGAAAREAKAARAKARAARMPPSAMTVVGASKSCRRGITACLPTWRSLHTRFAMETAAVPRHPLSRNN